jgi:RNA polymerase sigma-70 factor (ECF subfamily)
MIRPDNENRFYQLVEDAGHGDAESMDLLARQAHERLRAHFLRITLDIDLAADLTQETILRMIKSLPRLDNIESFWPWLFRIASNITKDHYRSKKHNPTRFSAMEPHHLEMALRDDTDKPERSLLHGEACALLKSAISTLKQSHRRALTMRCFDDMSYAQISHTCGCSELAVRTTVSRAKKTVRNYLVNNGLSTP